MVKSDLGAVSAYAIAVEHGYTGTEEEWAQLLMQTGANAQDAKDAKEAIENMTVSAASSAHGSTATVVKTVGPDWNVHLAFGIPKGAPGDPGDPGDPGKTPVRGTDYWTAADKQQIVQDTLAALPAWTWEAV